MVFKIRRGNEEMSFLSFDNGKAVCRVVGSMKLRVVAELKEEIVSVIEKGCNSFVFDFKETTFIDSTGLGVVIMVLRKLGKDKIRVLNLNGEVLNTFKNADLLREFHCQ